MFSCPTRTKKIERYLPEVFDAINVEIDGGIEAHQRMCNMGCGFYPGWPRSFVMGGQSNLQNKVNILENVIF